VTVLNPEIRHGYAFRKYQDDDGTVVRRLVMEGMAEVEGHVINDCRAVEFVSAMIDDAIDDPHDPIVDGTIKYLSLN